ncbi:MAG: hypothetical protein JWO56_2958 [Acidobacteria bacterium]|nr:hypothetical protein [Acidobacteriota bacterium]
MSGARLIVGTIFMGVLLPLTIFLLLGLHTIPQFLTIAASSFLAWGAGDLLATILERPRLQNRSPRDAFRRDWERRQND